MIKIKRLAFALCLPFAGPALAEGFSLALPIDCDLGGPCYIQQYVDHDPGPQAQDYRCAGLSYDGHQGTDFALPHAEMMRRGVNVLAAADGVVTGRRDGMADQIYTQSNAAAIKGRECGNGLVLRHAGGFETQYCHLKRGSVIPQKGARVRAGQVLGQVGMSGRAAFPHLHLSVRKDGAQVDPFAPEGHRCDAATPPVTLWQDTPAYRPGGIIGQGFAPAVPAYASVKDGTAAQPVQATSPSLVIYAHAFGLRRGDVLRLQLKGPEGISFAQDHRFKRPKAQAFRALGQKRRNVPWPTGAYHAQADLIRAGKIISSRRWQMTITAQ